MNGEGSELALSSKFLSDRAFTAIVSLGFFLLVGVGILHHEMWSDELMFWMMARDNSTLGSLFATLKFEYMHPYIWGMMLFALSRFIHDPLAMQMFHILIATGCVALLCQFAPFTRFQKLLLSFGYFFSFEYSVISRNYGLGVLVIFLFCVLFRGRHRSSIPLACVLAVMANVNFYSRMTAIALAATLILEYLRDRTGSEKVAQRQRDLWLSLLIFAAGVILSVIQNIPPDTGASVGLALRFQGVVSAIANLWKAYFPMPGLALRFWNSNILDDGTAAALSWIPLGFSLALFHRRPLILFLYLFNLTEILLFHSLWTGLMRHIGHVFILFIVCLWLSNEVPALPEPATRDHPLWRFFNRYQAQFVSVVLAMQLIAGSYAFGMDFFNPFSEAKAVAQFIQRQNLSDRLIAGSIDVFTQSVSGHLDQPIFYPERDRLGTYISSDNTAHRLNPDQLLTRISQTKGSDNALLVLNTPLPKPLKSIPNWGLQELATFNRGIVKVENYYLYLFQRLNNE